MIEYLEHIDRELFLLLNGCNSPFMDRVMWFISGKLEWIPFYVLLLYLLIKNYRKQSWIILLSVAALIALSDQISVHFFKDFFERFRPCHNLETQDLVHRVNNKCGGQFGFVSSHASNSFAVSDFVGLFLRKHMRYALILLLLWAALVSYSRVYLGVHYPGDILGGAILGSSLAVVMFFITKRILKFKYG